MMLTSSIPSQARPGTGRAGRRARSAFTLIEMVVAASILAVVVGVVATATAMAARVIPRANDPVASSLELNHQLARLANEAALARQAWFNGGEVIRFIVADITGDGAEDEVVYAWDGASGSPVTRSVNGSAPVAFIASVGSISAVPTTRRTVLKALNPAVIGPEVLLNSWDGATNQTTVIGKSRSLAQAFGVTAPSDAVSWSVTRVRFKALESAPNTEVVAVSINTTDDDGAPVTQLFSASIPESSFPSFIPVWIQQAVTGVSGIAPRDRLAIVITSTQNSAAQVPWQEKAQVDGSCSLGEKVNSSWTINRTGAMPFEVYGHVTAPAMVETTTDRLVSVAFHARPTQATARSVRVGVRLVTPAEMP